MFKRGGPLKKKSEDDLINLLFVIFRLDQTHFSQVDSNTTAQGFQLSTS